MFWQQLVNALVSSMELLIFIRALLSFFPGVYRTAFYRFVYDVTEPVLRPVRRLLPSLGPLDLSPWITFLLLELLRKVLLSLF